MSGPHNPDSNISLDPTGSEDTVILRERGREIPADILEAAENALDDMLCECTESCGGTDGLRKDAISKIAAAILAERDRCLDCQPSTAENPNEDAYQRGRFDGIMEFARAIAQPTTSDSTKLRRSKALDELGALDGELLP